MADAGAAPGEGFAALDLARLPTPCHVIDVAALEANLRLLAKIGEASGAKILLALKAFAPIALADLVGAYLHGTAASGLFEARLAARHFSGEVHCFAPGLKAEHLAELDSLCDHLVFNSLGQWRRFSPGLKGGASQYGIRLNPRHSEAENPLYDPCAPYSRLGVGPGKIERAEPGAFGGALIHGLCDQGYEPFDRLLAASEAAFGDFLGGLEWINLGGGQLLTAPDYPRNKLIARLSDFTARTGLQVYLEPGTAAALNAGALIAEVLDTGCNDGHFAILDASATCHMPDVIEAPFTPDMLGAATLTQSEQDPADPCTIRLGGPSCLAGDIIGTYRFPTPLEPGDRVAILDQAYYTMVKANTFNGTPLPAIALWEKAGDRVEVIREFGFEDFKSRLA